MAEAINRVGVRNALPARKEPYWTECGENTFLGYRKTETGSQTWIARYQQGKRKQYRSLGKVASLTYGEALKLAAKFGDECRQGVGRAPTVAQACEAYAEYLEVQKRTSAATDNRQRFAFTVGADAKFRDIRLDRLTVSQVQDWLNRQAARGAKSITVNRDFARVRAALNHAYNQDVTTTAPWRKVKPLPTDASPRQMYLDLDQRKRLLEASGFRLGQFIRGLLYTGTRPGELRAAKVGDFDKVTGTLTVTTHKGRDGVARTRSIPLSIEAQVFLKECAAGKLPEAPLFNQEYGKPWEKKALNREFEKARKAARLSPELVPYTCRHTKISDWLSAGIDIATVSKIAGTSVAMIERHYHKYIKTAVQDKLNSIVEL